MAQAKRKDKARTVLKKGEGQRNNGTYYYRWQDKKGNRHYLYAKTLQELREQEKQVEKDKYDGIKAEARYTTVNDLYELWKQIKRGLKNSTYENYTYMYDMFASRDIGMMRISTLKKSDVKRFYNRLADERGLKPATIDNVHTVLHQVLDMAVDDDYIRSNPSDNVLKELKQSHCFQTEKRSIREPSIKRSAGSSVTVMTHSLRRMRIRRCCSRISAAIVFGTLSPPAWWRQG